MYKSDKYFWGIVGWVTLIIVYFISMQLVGPYRKYISEDTPEGVVNNYLLALHKEDYEKAYGYLSPIMLHYPRGVDEFTTEVKDEFPYNHENINGFFITVDSSDSRRVYANATRGTYQYYYRSTSFKLAQIDGEWKIYAGSEYSYNNDYFDRCWVKNCN